MRSRDITDETARKVFLLLAELTHAPGDPYRPQDVPEVMGLELLDADVPELARRVGIAPEEFRSRLRALRELVRMDVLEHVADGVWEIVYGPLYGDAPAARVPKPDLTRGGPHAFRMPGWEQFSTWGYESGPHGETNLYAQLIANQDGAHADPRIWITPPRYLVRDIEELATVIAVALVPYVPVPPPASLIKSWLTEPPRSFR
ncbi:hypothetical protein ACFWBN_02730 [Streptomyces sp. NPDC059989]|uniref:hypothetical protein n=1 Tax=Streptomyces sp. NPDC059989 TaxID=3347026 RepID=UPI003693D7E7